MTGMAAIRLDPPSAPRPAAAASSHFPPLARLRFRLRALDALRLPDYAGSAWRGLLGHGLRRTACVTRQPRCEGCLLTASCVYSTLFESPLDPAAPESGARRPHPFVLDLDPRGPRHFGPGEELHLDIHLFGRAIEQAPYLIHALALAGDRGLGRSGGRFRLSAVERERQPGDNDWCEVYNASTGVYQPREASPAELPAPPEHVRLRLITPLRLKRDNRLLGAREFSPLDLSRALARRLRELARHHGGDPEAFASLGAPQLSNQLEMHIDWLRWHEWTRYSSRQDRHMQLGGLIGALELSGPALAPLWPALWFGQWAHLGKGTSFGLGGYRLEGDAHKLVRTIHPT